MLTTAQEARDLIEAQDIAKNVSLDLNHILSLIEAACLLRDTSVILEDEHTLSSDLETLVSNGFTIHRVTEWHIGISW